MLDNSYTQEDIKELSPGIWLHKEKIEQDSNELSIWKVEIKTMSLVDFSIDFTGSTDISFVDSNNNNMQCQFQINPFEIKEIAKIILTPNSKVKAKFKIELNVPDKEFQKQFLEKELTSNQQVLNECKQNFTNNNFEFIPNNEIENTLNKNQIHKYIDYEFPPNDESFGGNASEFDYIIHWRRPEHFVLLSEKPNDIKQIKIINNNEPEPNDVHQENLSDYALASALSGIAEKYNMITRLFLTRDTSLYGIYQIQLWLNGQKRIVVVDDLFPCIPMGNPLVTRSPSNEIWVLLLEKAVAKLLGNYYRIQSLTLVDSLLLLTGCPTFCYPIENENYNDNEYKSDMLKKIKTFVIDKKYLVMAINNHLAEEEEQNENVKGLTIPGLGYSILDILSIDKHIFLKLRKVWFDQNEQNIDKNVQAYHEQYNSIIPELENEITEGKMFLSLEDFLKEFNELAICYVKSWEEIRLRGEFIIPNGGNRCISKWYYCLTLNTPGTVILGLFQDEDKVKDTDSRKPIIDMSLSVLKYVPKTNELSHIQTVDFAHSSSLQQELELKAGTYIILPRSSGLFLGKPIITEENIDSKNNKESLYNNKTNTLTPIFIETIKDIFKRYDINLKNKLNYNEFSLLYNKCTNKQLEKSEFNRILTLYSNHNASLTERGLINYFKNIYEQKGDKIIWDWLYKLGYSNDLYCEKSRNFILTIHSNVSVSINTRECLGCEINSMVNKILMKNFGNKFTNKKQGTIVPIMYRSKLNGIVSVGCENKSRNDMLVKLKIGENGNVIHKCKDGIEKVVKGNDCEFFDFVFTFNLEGFDEIDCVITSKST